VTRALGGVHPVTVTITGSSGQAIGTCAARLVLTPVEGVTDPRAWAITHALGSPAGGTHTEVVLVDDSLARDEGGVTVNEHIADGIVRTIAGDLYGRAWAFHYRPGQVPDAVLRHGSRLRERVEVTEVELWA